MFVAKNSVGDCFIAQHAQIRAKMCMRAGIRAYLREEATLSGEQYPWLRILELSQRTCIVYQGNVRICQFVHSIFRFFDDI